MLMRFRIKFLLTVLFCNVLFCLVSCFCFFCCHMFLWRFVAPLLFEMYLFLLFFGFEMCKYYTKCRFVFIFFCRFICLINSVMLIFV